MSFFAGLAEFLDVRTVGGQRGADVVLQQLLNILCGEGLLQIPEVIQSMKDSVSVFPVLDCMNASEFGLSGV